jgi:hypothetical protein
MGVSAAMRSPTQPAAPVSAINTHYVHRGGHSGLQLAGIDRQGADARRDRVRIDHYVVRCPINLEGESHRRLQTESSTAEGCARRQLFV